VARASVLFGGPSPEHDVSILTGLQVCRVLSRGGHEVFPLYWMKSGAWYAIEPNLEADAFVTGVPQKSRLISLSVENGFAEQRPLGRTRRLEFDVAVNCCHGGPGEDGRLQGVLDLAGIKYTGPTAPAAALGMDKLAFAGVVAAAGLPTLPRTALLEEGPPPGIPLPWILKPRYGGSSIGIHVVDSIETARQLLRSSRNLRSGAVIEPYLDKASDLNISVRGHGTPAFSEIERPIRNEATEFYSYEHKYLGGEGLVGAPRELPAALSPEIRNTLQSYASVTAELAQVRGVARIDFLLDGDRLWINEINTIPGAMSFYLWHASGVSHEALADDMLEEALKYPAYESDTTGADGLALRSAGAIASKLA
jgi:D-alanine-D-alanine ligase